MKKIIALCLVALFSFGLVEAQAQKKGGKSLTTTVFMTNLDCQGCAKKITDNIPLAKIKIEAAPTEACGGECCGHQHEAQAEQKECTDGCCDGHDNKQEKKECEDDCCSGHDHGHSHKH